MELTNLAEFHSKPHTSQPPLIGNPSKSMQVDHIKGEANPKCKPLQLLSYNRTTKQFEINNEALEGSIGIISLAGLYRTGKSYTLNLLLGVQGKGFQVDSSTNACTQGLWMWAEPVYVKESNMNIIFVDTEGFSATDSQATQDTKIFALVVLISSYLIYNTIGAIDESAINSLSTAAEFSKVIAINNSNASKEEILAHITPKFIWLLKDFTLQITDTEGRNISSNDYLENCLKNSVKQ